jgi:hypothetical protein
MRPESSSSFTSAEASALGRPVRASIAHLIVLADVNP